MWNSTPLVYGPLPLWTQIADRLRTAIEAGDFKPGDYLPSEAVLNRVFGISRTTARASLDRLEQEGLISRRSGKGSLVLAPKVEQPLNRFASFAEDMRGSDMEPSYATLAASFVSAPAEVADAFGIEPSARVFATERCLKGDAWPIAFSRSWLAPRVLEGRDPPSRRELDRGSLYAWLDRECGARIAGGHEYIEAGSADEFLAKQLRVPKGAPLLIARRLSLSAQDEPIEYVVLHYRADLYRFRIEFGAPKAAVVVAPLRGLDAETIA